MTETAAQRFVRVNDEYHSLLHIRPGDRTDAHKESLRSLRAELVAIVAVPPEGYSLPAAAQALVDDAERSGWRALVQWTPPGYEGEPFVRVQVGRRLSEDELNSGAYFRGTGWNYSLTWHSRGCSPGKVRLFGRGGSTTPDMLPEQSTDAPSVRVIRGVIRNNPVV